ncbi:MAG: DUF1015 domain-containing protein [Armatimonadota bacterium]|nr:MAG: DUF1015 domain-containing protein [Armatimonadota bacterium]
MRYQRRDLSDVLAPPYDIIAPDDEQRLLDRDPHNVVRLELGFTTAGAADDAGRYSRAAAALQQWRQQGVLADDDAPGLYPCTHTFMLDGESRTRLGVICAVRLTPFEERIVLPHEGTLRAPREDRRRLMLACRAQISPVFALHDDADGRIVEVIAEMMAEQPASEAALGDERHRLWRRRQDRLTDRYCELIAQGPIFIADGHHRYETALAVSRELQRAHPAAPAEAAFNHVLVLLCPAEQPGMMILPTHRVLRLRTSEQRARLDELLARHFETLAVECDAHPLAAARSLIASLEHADGRARFGIYTKSQGCRLLVAKPESLPNDPGPGGINELGTVLIHRLLIDPILGADGCGEYVDYAMDEAEAVRRVNEGQAECALLLRPTTVEQVKRVASAGLRMPGKSTYFYPKAVTGLVINDTSAERTIP